MLNMLPEPFQTGVLTPLAQGFTNQVFCLTQSSQQFFVRIPTQYDSELQIDRGLEQAIIAAVAAHQITPMPLYSDETGLVILPWISEPTWRAVDYHDMNHQTALLAQLRIVHQLQMPAKQFELLTYLQSWYQKVGEIPSSLQSIYVCLEDWLSENSQYDAVFCHNDLHSGNLLGQRPWIIDWEYAGYNDPAFEFAVIAEHANFSSKEILNWIDTYNAAGGNCIQDRIEPMRLYVCFLSYFWHRRQSQLTRGAVFSKEAERYELKIKKSMQACSWLMKTI